MLSLGDIDISAVVVSRFALDGGSMFGVVPRAVWAPLATPDPEGRIPLVARILVVSHRRAGYRALLETGLGDCWTPSKLGLFAADGAALPAALRASGIDPSTITDVVLTHLHWDHAGGLLTNDPATGPSALALPGARIHVGETQLAHAQKPSLKDRASYRPNDLEVLGAPGVRRLADRCEVLPGLFASRSDGHTEGLLVLEVRASGQRVVFPSDLAPTYLHARAAWGMAFDNLPLRVVEEKAELMAGVARDEALIVPYHDPTIEAYRVKAKGERFETVPATL